MGSVVKLTTLPVGLPSRPVRLLPCCCRISASTSSAGWLPEQCSVDVKFPSIIKKEVVCPIQNSTLYLKDLTEQNNEVVLILNLRIDNFLNCFFCDFLKKKKEKLQNSTTLKFDKTTISFPLLLR